MRSAGRWVLIFMLVVTLAGLKPTGVTHAAIPARPAQQINTLTILSPTSCPGGGCAAGQRMNLRFDFEFLSYSPDANPNVKFCIYAPTGWNVEADPIQTIQGELTAVDYQPINDCSPDVTPDGYTLVIARQATITGRVFSDAVTMALRIGPNPTGAGRFLARLFESTDGTTFIRTQQALAAILSVTPAAVQVFVANDAATCGSRSPCYLNSGDDLPDGLGTGLRDAVQAVPNGAIITALGTYTIKSNTVLIDRPVTLNGIDDSRITYSGSGPCSEAMLSLQAAVTLQGLNINDGTCSNPSRSLVEINSSSDVLIESNDLTGGDNAIYISDNSGTVRVRYNHVSGNAGFAIYAEGHSRGGALEVVANNLHANGNTIECSATATAPVANRRVNHNYWGQTSPTQQTSHCTLAEAKRLGAPIALRTGAAGVNVQLVTVRETKTYVFSNQIAFRRSGGSDYNLYIVDHGFLTSSGAPFTTAAGQASPSACSTYWDVFLPDGVSPTGALELSFKYDRITACQATINSSLFCGQSTTPALYPLYWYDPGGVTGGWDTTGQKPENLTTGEGQATTCVINASEIQVSIDNTGRPALAADLGYTPFMVAVPILRSFQPLARNQAIDIVWTTNVEPDVTGFYVLRGESPNNLSQIGEFIPRRGTALTGVISPPYTYVDTGLQNNVTYYYRLQIVRASGSPDYSQIVGLAANLPTITPTFTVSPTRTSTIPRPTPTPRPTNVPTQRPTAVPTWSATPRTETPTATLFILETSTAETPAYPLPGDEMTGTPVAAARSVTPSPSATRTISPGAVEYVNRTAAWPWISLLLGLLAGLAAVAAAAGGWWWYLRK